MRAILLPAIAALACLSSGFALGSTKYERTNPKYETPQPCTEPARGPHGPLSGGGETVAREPVRAHSPIDNLIDAMAQVESGGRVDAVGDGGRSIGPLQIMRAYWQDAVEHSKRRGDRWQLAGGTYPASVRDPAYARRCVLAYADRWGARMPEEIARAHNSGPAWRSKRALTDGYWSRVEAALVLRRSPR